MDRRVTRNQVPRGAGRSARENDMEADRETKWRETIDRLVALELRRAGIMDQLIQWLGKEATYKQHPSNDLTIAGTVQKAIASGRRNLEDAGQHIGIAIGHSLADLEDLEGEAVADSPTDYDCSTCGCWQHEGIEMSAQEHCLKGLIAERRKRCTGWTTIPGARADDGSSCECRSCEHVISVGPKCLEGLRHRKPDGGCSSFTRSRVPADSRPVPAASALGNLLPPSIAFAPQCDVHRGECDCCQFVKRDMDGKTIMGCKTTPRPMGDGRCLNWNREGSGETEASVDTSKPATPGREPEEGTPSNG